MQMCLCKVSLRKSLSAQVLNTIFSAHKLLVLVSPHKFSVPLLSTYKFCLRVSARIFLTAGGTSLLRAEELQVQAGAAGAHSVLLLY